MQWIRDGEIGADGATKKSPAGGGDGGGETGGLMDLTEASL